MIYVSVICEMINVSDIFQDNYVGIKILCKSHFSTKKLV